ncbi:MAG: hypothetical protein N2Z74_08685, partial [Syntrophales bacterium]|nr:hypothetical protein [Syntrophales bacterium]
MSSVSLRPLIFAALLLLAGCATSGELKVLRQESQGKMSVLEDRIAAVETSTADLRKETAKTDEAVTALRKSSADVRADLTELREQLQQIRGLVELSLIHI